MGDVVQFIPDPKVRGASVLVEFVGKNPATMKGTKKPPTKSPFRAGKIQSSAFHTVVNEIGKFWASCFVVTADGTHIGYLTDGRVGCSDQIVNVSRFPSAVSQKIEQPINHSLGHQEYFRTTISSPAFMGCGIHRAFSFERPVRDRSLRNTGTPGCARPDYESRLRSRQSGTADQRFYFDSRGRYSSRVRAVGTWRSSRRILRLRP